LSEIGDRTFILVTIFSQKLNKLGVFIVGSLAMVVMHVVSVLIGAAFPYLLSKTVTELICVVLFLGFGIFLVYQAIFDDDDDREKEREEIVEKLQEVSQSMEEGGGDDEAGHKKKKKKKTSSWIDP